MSKTSPARAQRGFTLIELVIFIVIVGVGLAGILSVIQTTVKSSADPLVRKQGVAIAESLLEEILLKDYSAPSDRVALAADTTRADFNNVSDYDGYSTSAGIVDQAGEAVAGLTRYNISPAVTVLPASDFTGADVKKVTVSVTAPGVVITLSGYRGNY